MAVYIKQSPPREGVRGGWEDFKWESLKTQTNADRDYYLGECNPSLPLGFAQFMQ